MQHKRAYDLAQATIRDEIAALEELLLSLDDSFWGSAQMLSDCSGIIWTTGVGTSAAVASRFAHILTDCGARSMFLTPADGLHGHSAVMIADDALVAMSRGGETAEVIKMAEVAVQRGVRTMAMVHNVSSTLAQTCDHVLPVRSKQDYELMHYVATTSTVVFCAMCDALSAVVLQKKGYTPEQLAQVHPGGAVGEALAALHGGEGNKAE